MKITKKVGINEIVLSLEGRLDSITSPELQDTLISAFDEYAHVSLDFGALTYISSAGLRILLMAHKTAHGRKSSFTILNVSEQVMKVLDLTGLARSLSINPAKSQEGKHSGSSESFREEHDFLGGMRVPADAYYGIQTLRAAENFPITGYRIHESLIVSLAMVKKAAALANMEVGFLDKKIGTCIAEAATEIIEGKYHDQFIVDPIQGGAGTSINMNTNEVIANIALEKMGFEKGDYSAISPNTHVNMSQSTNDAVPTAAHICVRMLLNGLLETMKELKDTFIEKAREFDSFIKMGRTHLQDAVPIRLGQEFDAYARVFSRDIVRIGACGQYLNEVNMGATAVGTGLNAYQSYIDSVTRNLQEISGFPIWQADSLVDATQNTDCYTEVSAALKVCSINMSKIANDLRLMASGPRCGLFEINLPPRQPGSSIMPGKVNPVMAELINQVSFQVIGSDQTICLASEAGQFELNVMAPVLIFNLVQSICIMNNAFRVFNEHCVKGITVNEDRMRRYVDESIGTVTAVGPHIGYEKASMIAREALETGQTVRELCLRHNVLTGEQLDEILEPFAMTRPKTEKPE